MKPELLFVDDSETMRQFLGSYFAKNYQVHTAANAKEAWAWLEAGHSPVMAVLDLKMPEVTGLELLSQLRASERFSELPVIILSSEENSQERLKCLQIGAVDYMVKPFNPKELEHRIQFYIKLCRAM